MAENITSNVRQIEGVVNKIMAFQELMGEQVDVETTIRAVRDILRTKEDFLPSADTIIQEVARFYELDSSAIRGQGQNKEITTARNVAMYIKMCIRDRPSESRRWWTAWWRKIPPESAPV